MEVLDNLTFLTMRV